MPPGTNNLPCLVNGHTPPDPLDEIMNVRRKGNCKFCGIEMRLNKIWAGMKWDYWWTALEQPKGF